MQQGLEGCCGIRNVVLDDLSNWNAVMSTTRKCMVQMPGAGVPATNSQWAAAEPLADADGYVEAAPQARSACVPFIGPGLHSAGKLALPVRRSLNAATQALPDIDTLLFVLQPMCGRFAEAQPPLRHSTPTAAVAFFLN